MKSCPSCKTADEKAEKPDTQGKKPEARKADAGGKGEKGDLQAETPKGKPHCSGTSALVRGVGRRS